VSTALLSGTDPAEVLDLVVRRAREICDADLALVALAGQTPDVVRARRLLEMFAAQAAIALELAERRREFAVRPREGGGTVLEWRVPLESA
jgi:hypothetical protein